jgi:hypothetical protein
LSCCDLCLDASVDLLDHADLDPLCDGAIPGSDHLEALLSVDDLDIKVLEEHAEVLDEIGRADALSKLR